MSDPYADLAAPAALNAQWPSPLAAVPAPPQPLMAELGERVSRLQNILGASDATLSDLRTRLFGPWPTPGQSAANMADKSPSLASELLAMLDRAIAKAAEARESAEFLNGRL